MKAYLIARVSTEDQKDALPAQVHRLHDYANRLGYSYELIEFQESAYKGDREFSFIIHAHALPFSISASNLKKAINASKSTRGIMFIPITYCCHFVISIYCLMSGYVYVMSSSLALLGRHTISRCSAVPAGNNDLCFNLLICHETQKAPVAWRLFNGSITIMLAFLFFTNIFQL